MRAFRVCVLVVVLSVLFAGCGGGDSSGDAAASGEPQPLQGKELGKASQLTGTWLAMTDGDFIGFEFMKDNKVLATHAMQAAFTGTGSGMMMTYDILEGGRLSLTGANGQTQVYTVTVKGDSLELRGNMMFANTDFQQFRRLPSGQTLEEAIKEEEAKQAKAARERYDTVTEFIKQPGLVIVCTTPGPGAPVSVAIAPADASGPQKGYHDDTPPHLDQISVSPSIEDSGKKAVANVVFGPQLDPPPTQRQGSSGSIAFDITGEGKKLTALAKVNYGGASYELELKRDEKLYKQIVGRFEDEKKRIEAMKQPIIDVLKDFAVLEGQVGSEYANQGPDTARFSLVRDESGGYQGDGVLVRNGQAGQVPNTTAQVTVLNNQAMLIINAYNRNYQMTLDEAGGAFTGGWFYGNNPQGKVANLSITLAEDQATRTKRLERLRQAWANIDQEAPFLGFVEHNMRWMASPAAVSLKLTPATNNQVAGVAVFPTVETAIDVQGQLVETVSGPQLQLRFGSARPGSTSPHAGHIANTMRNQTWVLTLVDSSVEKGPLQLTNGARVMTQTTDAAAAELRKELIGKLGAGIRMTVRHSADPNNPLIWQLTSDGSGAMRGSTVSGAMYGGFHPQSTMEGTITSNANLPFLTVRVFDPPPAKAGAFHRVYGSELLAYPTEDGWRFVGRYWPETNKMGMQYYDMVELKN